MIIKIEIDTEGLGGSWKNPVINALEEYSKDLRFHPAGKYPKEIKTAGGKVLGRVQYKNEGV